MQGEVENFDEIMTALRKVRCGAITNEKEYAYLMYSIAAGVMRKIGVEFWNDFESLKYYCQNVIDGSYDGRDSRFNKLTCQEYQNEHAEMKKTIKKKREEFCKLNELEKSLDTAKSLSEYEEKGSVPTDGRTPSTASEVKKPAENQEKKGLSSPLPTSLKSKKSTKNNKSEKKNVKDQPQGKNENATKDGKSGKKSDKKVDAKKL
ncbi:hypothetical protein GCK72_008266 [Caenorhabditis remanei]|uniref:Uncharacterized protein n=1 Tax=Caenorhabditis remanei TaxID=31234 RepID=A0A6A5GX19_CAERE|nr:hypothetical protein GCK72_008266 [Caenorhabditis remanei]KAF1760020.1 hypothetical protein GCK72_008266 [Caenorhabditis remanei]